MVRGAIRTEFSPKGTRYARNTSRASGLLLLNAKARSPENTERIGVIKSYPTDAEDSLDAHVRAQITFGKVDKNIRAIVVASQLQNGRKQRLYIALNKEYEPLVPISQLCALQVHTKAHLRY